MHPPLSSSQRPTPRLESRRSVSPVTLQLKIIAVCEHYDTEAGPRAHRLVSVHLTCEGAKADAVARGEKLLKEVTPKKRAAQDDWLREHYPNPEWTPKWYLQSDRMLIPSCSMSSAGWMRFEYTYEENGERVCGGMDCLDGVYGYDLVEVEVQE